MQCAGVVDAHPQLDLSGRLLQIRLLDEANSSIDWAESVTEKVSAKTTLPC